MGDSSNTPKVSILIPVWNRETVIEETVHSALSQTLQDIEVVIVDNASTDNTWNILEKLSKDDERIRIFQNATNLGPVRNWIRCIEEAKAEFSKILWSDDLISPDYLEKTLPLLDSDTGFVYTAARVIFEGDNEDEILYLQPELDNNFKSSIYVNNVFLKGGKVPVSPGCAVMRTQDLKRVLNTEVKNRINSDFSMHAIGPDLLIFLRLCEMYPNVGYVIEPLSQFKAHADSITIRESSSGKLKIMYNIAKAVFIEESGAANISKKSLRHFLKKISSSKSLKQSNKFGIKTWQTYFPSDQGAQAVQKHLPLSRKLFSS
jgi:glycosyltransferase involved in cell wall biosynthesis